MTIYLVSTFYPKLNQAKKIAKLVVKNKLAACVNINKNINSIYIWENKMFRTRPALCDGDGPIGLLRKWYRQFNDMGYETKPFLQKK